MYRCGNRTWVIQTLADFSGTEAIPERKKLTIDAQRHQKMPTLRRISKSNLIAWGSRKLPRASAHWAVPSLKKKNWSHSGRFPGERFGWGQPSVRVLAKVLKTKVRCLA
jgi:hypothetical protein